MLRYKVPDMGCDHCVETIEKAVKALDPTAQVACDLDTKEVAVETALSPSHVSAALKAVGYDSTTIAADA